jgi:hypothetical protein
VDQQSHSARIVDAIEGWRTIVRGRHLRRATGYENPATGTRVAGDTDASAHILQEKPAFLAEVLMENAIADYKKALSKKNPALTPKDKLLPWLRLGVSA